MPEFTVSAANKTDEEKYTMVIKTKGKADDKDFKTNRPPREVEYSGFAGTYNEVLRPDRQPILRRSGQSLKKMSMTLLVMGLTKGFPDLTESVDTRLKALEKLASSRVPLIIEYDPRMVGTWHITAMSYKSMERYGQSDGTVHITRAEVTLEFTEVPDPTDVTINKVLLSNKRPKTYKFKKKDTLQKVVKKFYGTDSMAIIKAVAKVNKIKDLKHIKPGKILKLP